MVAIEDCNALTGSEAMSLTADADEVAGGARPAILLVEDEPTTRLMVARQLERAGYSVVAVANGAQALAYLEKQFIPLLLTDWEMPEMNGVALCRAVRDLPLPGYVYTILLTAREGKANVIEGLAAGADDYLIKPPDDDELRARLNTGRRILGLEQSLRAANRRIHLLSITDELTGTYNRRYLMENLPREIARGGARRLPVSVVLCDVDHFKRVNDTYGHQAGDEVLRVVATIIKDALRGGIDWAARYGGEEFMVVLPETTVAAATEIAERIRRNIHERVFEFGDRPLRLSASFGVCGHESSQTPQPAGAEPLIAAADECLYQAKNAGRNRVVGRNPGGVAAG